MLSMIVLILLAGDFRLPAEPLVFEDETNPDSFVTAVFQIETDGSRLFIRENKDPRILVLESDGTYVARIGKPGRGPEELGRFGFAFSARGNRFWVMRDDARFLHYYEGAEYLHQLKIKSYNHEFNRSSKTFAFDRDHVILQAYPNQKARAYAYAYSGEVVHAFPNLFDDKASIGANLQVNDGLWAGDERYWYCLFKCKPLLMIYDKSFATVSTLTLQGPEIQDATDEMVQENPARGQARTDTMFTDLKVVAGTPYAMCRSVLMQIDPATGRTENRVILTWRKPDGTPVPKIWNHFFVVLDDGRLIATNTFQFHDHHLWQVELPFPISLL